MVVIQRVEEVTACCKVFLSKSQELQVRMSVWCEKRSAMFSKFNIKFVNKWQLMFPRVYDSIFGLAHFSRLISLASQKVTIIEDEISFSL